MRRLKRRRPRQAAKNTPSRCFLRNAAAKLAVVSTLYIIFAQAAVAENILTNPGFESGTTGWSAFGGSFTTSSEIKRSGTYSGKSYNRTGKWNGLQQNMMGKMESGKTYTISGWIMLEGAGSGGDTIQAAVRQKDDRDGAVLTDDLKTFTNLWLSGIE